MKKEFTWLEDVSSIYLQQSIRHLNKAYKDFFEGIKGFPQFKKKQEKNSITLVGEKSIHFDKAGNLTLPKSKSPLTVKFSREFNRANISSITLSKTPGGQFFASFLVKESIAEDHELHTVLKPKIGLDLGLKTTIVAFDGENHQSFDLPKTRLEKLNLKIKKQQRILAKKKKQSKNRFKARKKLARLYETKNNIVEDFYHKTSSHLVKHYKTIVTEDLDIKGLKEKKVKGKLKQNLHQSAWGKFLRMLQYKSEWQAKTHSQVNRYFPSSQLCSKPSCSYRNKKLILNTREWICPECGTKHDRDENASKNIFNYSGEFKSNIKIESKQQQKPSAVKKTKTKHQLDPRRKCGVGLWRT